MNPLRFIVLFFIGLSLTACLNPPGSMVIKKTTKPLDFAEWHDMKNHYGAEKNLLLFAVEDMVQDEVRDQAPKWARKHRLEKLAWWLYSRPIGKLYDNVLRVSHKKFTAKNLIRSFKFMERFNKPYDVFFMVHGIPNHYTASKGHRLINWKDIGKLKGLVPGLRMVYSQSCYGATLMEDWMEIGAESVISYQGLNRNFFYLESFLENYKKKKYDAEKAYLKTNKKIDDDLRSSDLYNQLVGILGLTMEEYLQISPPPDFIGYK